MGEKERLTSSDNASMGEKERLILSANVLHGVICIFHTGKFHRISCEISQVIVVILKRDYQ